jgi:hypothetical protein
MDYERGKHQAHLLVHHRVYAAYDPANLRPEPRREAAPRDQLAISHNHKVCAGTISLKSRGAIADPTRWRL